MVARWFRAGEGVSPYRSRKFKNMETLIFNSDLKKKAEKILNNYPQKRAALLPILRLIQETYGFISEAAEQEAAEFLEIPVVDVKEVMTFYTLFYLKPCAKNQLSVCRTLTCSLLGSDKIVHYLKERLGIDVGQQTPDGKFGLETVECLGACEIAPMMMAGKEYIGPLTIEKIDEILRNAE